MLDKCIICKKKVQSYPDICDACFKDITSNILNNKKEKILDSLKKILVDDANKNFLPWPYDEDKYRLIIDESFKREQFISNEKCVIKLTQKEGAIDSNFDFVSESLKTISDKATDKIAPKILHFNWMGDGNRIINKDRWEKSLSLLDIKPKLLCFWVSDLQLFSSKKKDLISMLEKNVQNKLDDLTCLILPFDYMFCTKCRNEGNRPKLRNIETRLYGLIIRELYRSNLINAADITRLLNVSLYGGAYFDFGKKFERGTSFSNKKIEKNFTNFWKCTRGIRWHLTYNSAFNNDMIVVNTEHVHSKFIQTILKKIIWNFKTVKSIPHYKSGYYNKSPFTNQFYYNYTLETTGPAFLKPMVFKSGANYSNQKLFFPKFTQGASNWHTNPKGYPYNKKDGDSIDTEKMLIMILKNIKKYVTIGIMERKYIESCGPKLFSWKHSTFFMEETMNYGYDALQLSAVFINEVIDEIEKKRKQ